MKKRTKVLGLGLLGILFTRSLLKRIGMYSLKNKVVLITGGTRGLGLILARILNTERAKIVICARDEDELDQVAEGFTQLGTHVLTIPCDITDKDQVDAMMEEIKEKLGHIDVVINNAGIMQVAPEQEMTEENYRKSMDVHFWGPYRIINAALPTMMKRNTGRIVNIISLRAMVSFPHLLPYNVSKSALSGYSEGLTANLSKYHIKVLSVYPGIMRTGSRKNADVQGEDKKIYDRIAASAYLPGLSMDAEKAGRKIVDALKQGDKVLVLPAIAKLGNISHALFPQFVINLFEMVNRFLPDPYYLNQSEEKIEDTKSDIPTNEEVEEAEFAER